MDIQKISHGEPSWEAKVNGNFALLIQDSGMIKLTVLAPFNGNVFIKKIGNAVTLLADIKSDQSNTSIGMGTVIAKIPKNLLTLINGHRYFTAFQDGPGGFARLMINADTGSLFFNSATAELSTAGIHLNEVLIDET